MKKTKLLMLVWAYFAWAAITSMYSKKTDKEIQNEMMRNKDEWKSPCKVLLWNFIDVHTRLFSDVKDNVLTDENIDKFNTQKDRLTNVLQEYKYEGEKILKDLQDNWPEYSKEILNKLNDLYEEKKVKLQKNKVDFPEIIEEYEDKLFEKFAQFKRKINSKK